MQWKNRELNSQGICKVHETTVSFSNHSIWIVECHLFLKIILSVVIKSHFVWTCRLLEEWIVLYKIRYHFVWKLSNIISFNQTPMSSLTFHFQCIEISRIIAKVITTFLSSIKSLPENQKYSNFIIMLTISTRTEVSLVFLKDTLTDDAIIRLEYDVWKYIVVTFWFSGYHFEIISDVERKLVEHCLFLNGFRFKTLYHVGKRSLIQIMSPTISTESALSGSAEMQFDYLQIFDDWVTKVCPSTELNFACVSLDVSVLSERRSLPSWRLSVIRPRNDTRSRPFSHVHAVTNTFLMNVSKVKRWNCNF